MGGSIDVKTGIVSITTDRLGIFRLFMDNVAPQISPIEDSLHVPIWAVIPRTTELLQNYPNPFNPETWIPYKLSEIAKVELRIYNVSGQLVKVLDLGQQKPGTYIGADKAIYWDGKNEDGEEVSSGTYFYQLNTGKSTFIKKMVITR
jgi:hypothetical protein